MSRVRVYSGADAPEALRGTVVQGTSGIDLTTVTAAHITVRHPDGTSATWATSTSNVSPTSIDIVHIFSAAETAQLGFYDPVAFFTVPGGTVRAVLTGIEVVDPYA